MIDEKWRKRILLYVVIITFAAMLTLFTFTTWQTILLTTLLVTCVSYVIVLSIDKLTTKNVFMIREGFVSEPDTSGYMEAKANTDAAKSKYEWLENDELFDDFYASVFTKLTQNEALVQAETAICMEEFSKHTPKNEMNILDAACGIGIGTAAFKKLGAQSVVGIDKSQAMIRYARNNTLPGTTLTETEKQDIEFRSADLIGPGATAAAEFTDAALLYFSVYYFRDLDNLFRNLALWVKPGGSLAIEVVNKYKFEPILDSTNPWVGFSPQKYTKERVTKSKVVFDKFDYEADFELIDPKAEFRETFRFKDGSTRRQKHTMYMPNMPDIIKKAQNNGWTYTKYTDLMPLAFAYGYLLFFTRNAE
jgi:SAM-dependent methyltransferase